MCNNTFAVFIIFWFTVFACNAQDCNLTIEGKVMDEASGLPLSYVNVIIQGKAQGITTDEEGYFLFENICAGKYQLTFSYISHETKTGYVKLSGDTAWDVFLTPLPVRALDDVIIEGKKNTFLNQPNISLDRQAIEDNIQQNLSGLLENETGVYLIKNGSGISKPVVHGLYGNRLTILNHGLVQSGQQWGNDHSPEIDPFSADNITVLKGANALEYSGGSLGSAILIEPQKIGEETLLRKQIGYTYETNGRGHNLNARIEKYTPFLAWRVSGTLKKYGDKKTPYYFLNNTGIEEANLAVQLEKAWKTKFFLEVYASTFNTRLGILRGSHIGNLTDLEQALTRDIPYFTEPDFSYSIDAPKQHVSHHLTKIKAKYYLDENQILELVLGGQLNIRREFDVRRSGRTNMPGLSLSQYTFNAEWKYSNQFQNNWRLKIGNQNIINDNTNNPETGILPLIPDYISWKSGWFTTLSKNENKTDFNLGFRYDYEGQNVVAISQTIPREILRYDNDFHNLGALLGLKREISQTQTISFNSGYAMRNPAINELYSNGLHQGVSGIEEGDITLQTEKALKNTLEYKWLPRTAFSLNALLYHQRFKDYIFLNPQDEIRLTIRGTFPVFKYEQTDANIYGLDISTQFLPSKSIHGMLKYSYIKGSDSRNKVPLVYMPPNRLFGSLAYRAHKPLRLSSRLHLEELEVEVNDRFVFRQMNLLPEQDFVVPPPAYNLLGLKISTNVIFPTYTFRFFTQVDNLLNARYRDYLNRQRYFADAPGRSLVMGMNFKF